MAVSPAGGGWFATKPGPKTWAAGSTRTPMPKFQLDLSVVTTLPSVPTDGRCKPTIIPAAKAAIDPVVALVGAVVPSPTSIAMKGPHAHSVQLSLTVLSEFVHPPGGAKSNGLPYMIPGKK